MDFSSFTKPSYLLGGVGVTGASAAGIVGINNYVDGNRTGQDKLSRQGFALDTHQFDGSAASFNTRQQLYTASNATHRLAIKTGDCFRKFFPGVSDPGMPSGTTHVSPTTPKLQIKSHSDPIGCQVIKYSEKAASDSSIKKAFIYKSEVAVKTENFGWSLSVGSTNINTTSDSKFKLKEKALVIELRVLLMEKTSSSWSIKGGYVWKRDIEYNRPLSSDFVISDPESKESWFTRDKAHVSGVAKEENFTFPSDSDWTDKTYSGIWRVSKDDPSSYEIFHGPGSVGMWGLHFDSNDGSPTLTNIFGEYSSGKWTGLLTVSSVNLSSVYKPFKGKKGKWSTVEKYCTDLSNTRRLNDEQLSNLRDLCYTKAAG